jgi:RNA polymerase sigma-70 factor (sigma-E family)
MLTGMSSKGRSESPSGGRPSDPLEALDDLFHRHYRALVAVACLLVDDRGAGEEIVQEAFVRMHRSWDRIDDVKAAPAYLRTTVVNLARSRLRRREISRRLKPQAQPDASSAEDAVVLAEGQREMLAVLQSLPRRQRECLILRYYLDLSEAEIATTLGIAPGSVKAYAHRGLAALASKLESRQ